MLATGFELWNHSAMGEYGYGKYPDVISAIQFERIMNASGPTEGHIVRPSDGKTPKSIAFLSCVGSRDDEHGHAYCSKVCCMYNAKQALLVKDKLHDVDTYVFYMDIRANGKGYEEFVKRTIEEYGANYIRGPRIARYIRTAISWSSRARTRCSGRPVEVRADLVVLATAMQPQHDAKDLARKLGISTDQYNWFSEAHPKLKPVEVLTDGIYLAGACQYPKDIPDTVAQASRRGMQGDRPVQQGSDQERADDRLHQRGHLRGLRPVHGGLPVRRRSSLWKSWTRSARPARTR